MRLPQETSILCQPKHICPQQHHKPAAPCTIICKVSNGSYLVQVIGGGQYRHAHDHFQECHPDPVKPDTSNIGDATPAASTLALSVQAVRLPTAAAPATPT